MSNPEKPGFVLCTETAWDAVVSALGRHPVWSALAVLTGTAITYLFKENFFISLLSLFLAILAVCAYISIHSLLSKQAKLSSELTEKASALEALNARIAQISERLRASEGLAKDLDHSLRESKKDNERLHKQIEDISKPTSKPTLTLSKNAVQTLHLLYDQGGIETSVLRTYLGLNYGDFENMMRELTIPKLVGRHDGGAMGDPYVWIEVAGQEYVAKELKKRPA